MTTVAINLITALSSLDSDTYGNRSCFNDCKTIPNKNIRVCIYCALKPLKRNNLKKSVVDFITEGYQ